MTQSLMLRGLPIIAVELFFSTKKRGKSPKPTKMVGTCWDGVFFSFRISAVIMATGKTETASQFWPFIREKRSKNKGARKGTPRGVFFSIGNAKC